MIRKIRIAVTDNNAAVRRGVRTLLENHEGWEVCGESTTCAEAVEQVKRLDPDVVIVDMSMAEMNGFEAIRQIHVAAPEACVLILTMHNAEPMFHRSIEAGVRGYVSKSDLSGLIEAVETLCRKRALSRSSSSQTVPEGIIQSTEHTDYHNQDHIDLTPRQMHVLRLLALGKSNKEVAAALGISVRTAETHRCQIMRRLKIQTVSELVRFAVRNHLVEP